MNGWVSQKNVLVKRLDNSGLEDCMSEEFHHACATDEISDGEMKLVEVDERLVILFRVGDEFHCIDDVCTHDGGTLSDGELDGCQIECPRHGAR